MIRVNGQISVTNAQSDAPPSGVLHQQEFQTLDLAFLGSLLPGIIHNFATPLSGVLGATQLLEKRASTIEELVNNHDVLTQAEREELLKQFERNRTNVDILARNAKHLADLLQVLVQRINRGGSTVRDAYSLNDLLQNELRFLDAHLSFKHKVKKQVTLGSGQTVIRAVYGHVAAVIEEFVVGTLAMHDLASGILEMDFATDEGRRGVTLTIIARYNPREVPIQDSIELYLSLVHEEGCESEVTCENGVRRLQLIFPRPKASA
jgi:signal transduction histidine kinase